MRTSRKKPMHAFVDIAGIAFATGVFVIDAFAASHAADVVPMRPGRLRAPCADSESRFLAIKKFSWLAAFASHRRSPKPIFDANRADRFATAFRVGSTRDAHGERLIFARERERDGGDDAAAVFAPASDAEF
jgi:hypothetical protein